MRASVTEARVTVYVCVHMPRECVCERKDVHRVQYKVFTLKRLARGLGSESLVTRLFISLVRPSLEYAAPAWDSCSKHDAMSLERVQLLVARAILRISRRSCHKTDVPAKSAGQP